VAVDGLFSSDIALRFCNRACIWRSRAVTKWTSWSASFSFRPSPTDALLPAGHLEQRQLSLQRSRCCPSSCAHQSLRLRLRLRLMIDSLLEDLRASIVFESSSTRSDRSNVCITSCTSPHNLSPQLGGLHSTVDVLPHAQALRPGPLMQQSQGSGKLTWQARRLQLLDASMLVPFIPLPHSKSCVTVARISPTQSNPGVDIQSIAYISQTIITYTNGPQSLGFCIAPCLGILGKPLTSIQFRC
jgi:hypothetical protein